MVVAFALGARPAGQRRLAVERVVCAHLHVGPFHIGIDPRDPGFGLFQLALQFAFALDSLVERGGAAARVVERLQRGLGLGEARFDVAEFFDAPSNVVALTLFRLAFRGHLGEFGAKNLCLAVDSFGLARLAESSLESGSFDLQLSNLRFVETRGLRYLFLDLGHPAPLRFQIVGEPRGIGLQAGQPRDFDRRAARPLQVLVERGYGRLQVRDLGAARVQPGAEAGVERFAWFQVQTLFREQRTDAALVEGADHLFVARDLGAQSRKLFGPPLPLGLGLGEPPGGGGERFEPRDLLTDLLQLPGQSPLIFPQRFEVLTFEPGVVERHLRPVDFGVEPQSFGFERSGSRRRRRLRHCLFDLAGKIGVTAAQSLQFLIRRGQRPLEALRLASPLAKPGDLRFNRILPLDLARQLRKLGPRAGYLAQTLFEEPRLTSRLDQVVFDRGEPRAQLVASLATLLEFGQTARRLQIVFVARSRGGDDGGSRCGLFDALARSGHRIAFDLQLHPQLLDRALLGSDLPQKLVEEARFPRDAFTLGDRLRPLAFERLKARPGLVAQALRFVIRFQLALGLGEFPVGFGDQVIQVAQRVAQIVRRLAVLLDLQNLVEDALAVRRREREIVSERALRHADRGFEERGQIGPRVYAEMAAKPRRDLILLLHQSGLGLGVVNVVTASGVARDDVFAPVQVGNEGDRDLAAFGPAFDEIVAFVIEVIEQRPGDGFKNRGLARAVGAADGDDSRLERPFPFGVVLDVLELDSGDSQGGRLNSGQWLEASG